MTHLLSDFRYAIRSLRKAPLFTVLATTSIALGIGANVTIFTLLDQVVLRPLPVPRPDQLSGRGLFLVQQLADRWGVAGPDGTLVWFEIDRSAKS